MDFESRYLTANNRPGAPACSQVLVDGFREQLISAASELEEIAYPLLAALAIGAHRLDFLPYLFHAATQNAADDEQFGRVYKQFAGAIMAIFPSIGGPWCGPAQLYLAHVLEARGFKGGDALNTRSPIGIDDEIAGRSLLNNEYSKGTDGNLKNMLGIYCRDFDRLLQTVALGYCHVGVTQTGVFKQHQTEIILAASLASCGAPRSAAIHGKHALVLGNSVAAVEATYGVAAAINQWNEVPFTPVDVQQIAREVKLM